MDDLLPGADTLEEAKLLRREVTNVLASGGFVLRKWATNEPALLDCEAVREVPVALKLPQEEDTIKALGIRWIPQDDTFCFKVTFDIDSTNTKRQLLSD